MDPNAKKRLYELLNALREDVITDQQFSELDEMVCSDQQAAAEYVQFVQLWTEMHFFHTAANKSELSELYTLNQNKTDRDKDAHYLKYLIEMENNAPALEKPTEIPAPEPIKIRPERPIIKKFNLVYNTLVYSAAVLLISFVIFGHFSNNSYSVPVGKLTDSINAQWGNNSESLNTNDRLYTNQKPLSLDKGIVKIEFDTGTRVIIEAPASFEIDRDSIFMEYGRLYSKVSEMGLGFSVNTPTSKFVDHGTEFGVTAGKNGSTELHVIKGKVQLFAGSEGKSKSGKLIVENQAVRYDTNSDRIQNIEIQTNAFVRDISSSNDMIWTGQNINLADIVGGGNGFGTGKIDKGISLSNGSSLSDFNWVERRGSIEYHKVGDNPFIDGVIVPDSEDGILQVSSLGHTFKECPNTDGLYYDDIRNGGTIRISEARDASRALDTQENSPMMFNGKQYGTPGNPLLFMHSNACITFDLDALRSSMPGFNIISFQSDCILLERADMERLEKVDIFILIDGIARLQKLGFDQNNMKIPVNIPLAESDRFLTLVVTDGGDGIAIDWVGFIDPKIIVE